MHDIQQPSKQMALRASLQKTKFTIEMACLQMLKMMLDTLSVWEKVGDNDRYDFIKLNSYYALLLEKWPTQPAEKNVVRVRFRLAEKVFKSDPSLGNVQATITDLVDFAKAVGVPEIIKAAPGTILAIGALAYRLPTTTAHAALFSGARRGTTSRSALSCLMNTS